MVTAPTQEFDFIVRKLTGDEMLKIMAHENDEIYGSTFLVTMETVRSLVEAHSKQEIKKLTLEHQGGHGRISVAELGFVAGGDETYLSPVAVGRYFGWLEKQGTAAPTRIHTALHALRLIAGGHCTEAQFRGIGNEQALAVMPPGRRRCS